IFVDRRQVDLPFTDRENWRRKFCDAGFFRVRRSYLYMRWRYWLSHHRRAHRRRTNRWFARRLNRRRTRRHRRYFAPLHRPHQREPHRALAFQPEAQSAFRRLINHGRSVSYDSRSRATITRNCRSQNDTRAKLFHPLLMNPHLTGAYTLRQSESLKPPRPAMAGAPLREAHRSRPWWLFALTPTSPESSGQHLRGGAP